MKTLGFAAMAALMAPLLAALFAGLFGSGTAWGSGFHTAEYHAAYIGQALAGITMTENAGVIATLPAAMVRVAEGDHVLGGLTHFDAQYDATPTDTSESPASEIGGTIIAPHAYYLQNFQSWAWGVGLYFPFNDVIKWPQGWAGRTELVEEELNIRYLSFSGAYALNREFSFGGSLIYIDGKARLERDTDALSGFGVPFVPLQVTADDQRFGLNVSVMYDSGSVAIGLNHSPKYSLEGEGDIKFDRTGVPGGLQPFVQDRPITATLGLPSLTELGVSYRDRADDPDLFVELTILRTGWSNFREIPILDKETGAEIDIIDKRWEDTIGIKFGGNYVFSRSGDANHRVRGGIYLDESPIPADTLAPDVPDGEGRTEFAVGYGYKRGGFLVDVS